MMKLTPAETKHEAEDEDMTAEMSTPYCAVDEPVTQHCRSVGPTQQPEQDLPPFEEHSDVCMQVPFPEGVEQDDCVQHFMSDDPGQRFEVDVPM